MVVRLTLALAVGIALGVMLHLTVGAPAIVHTPINLPGGPLV